MLIWKDLLKKVGPLGGFTLLIAACAGSGGARPLPTPESTTVAASDLPEEVDGGPTRIPAEEYEDLEIVTLLPRDAIPAIDDPHFLSSKEADDFYDPDELVLGVDFDGEARAYSVPFLSNHEIVNDTVGGVKIAVTW